MVTRIRELLESKQLSPTQFADLIGVGRPVVSHILSDRNKPSLEVVQRIIGAFPEISLPWLLSGTGTMLAAVAPSAAPASVAAVAAQGATAAEAAPAAQPAPIVTAPTAPASTPLVSQPKLAPAAPRPDSTSLAEPLVAAAASPPAPAAKPFRAPRFVPPVLASRTPGVAAPAADAPTPPPQPEPQAVAAVVPTATPALTPALPPAQSPSLADAALLPFLAEPGKAIRRIVIFYRDGSFADYHPEA